METGRHITAIHETEDFVRQLCDEANTETGCDLEYVGSRVGDRFQIRSRSEQFIGIGTAAELVHLIGWFQGGYMAARAVSATQ